MTTQAQLIQSLLDAGPCSENEFMKNMFPDFETFVPTVNLKKCFGENYKVRDYQKFCIHEVEQWWQSEIRAASISMACGGGKTIVGILYPILMALEENPAGNFIIVGPSLALLKQHANDVYMILKRRQFLVPITITHFNSSETEAKEEVLADFDKDETTAKDFESSLSCKISTTLNRESLKKILRNGGINIVLVTDKTFIKNEKNQNATFVHLVNRDKIDITLTLVDEYHNLDKALFSPSQKASDRKEALENYQKLSRMIFVSASKKRNWDKPIFGQNLVDIEAAFLVKWDWLVPNLKVKLIINQVVKRCASSSDEEYYLSRGIPKEQIQMVIEEQSATCEMFQDMVEVEKIVPKGLVFGKRVAFGRTYSTNKGYYIELSKIVGHDVYLNQISSGHQYSRFGTEEKLEPAREEIISMIKQLPSEIASLTVQHSIFTEGIDVVNFTCGLINRKLGIVALQQGVGRISRPKPHTDTAVMYIMVGDNIEAKDMKEIIDKLYYTLGYMPELSIYGLDDERKSNPPEQPITYNMNAPQPEFLRNLQKVIEQEMTKIRIEQNEIREKIRFVEYLTSGDYSTWLSEFQSEFGSVKLDLNDILKAEQDTQNEDLLNFGNDDKERQSKPLLEMMETASEKLFNMLTN